MKLIIEGAVEGISTRADGSVKLIISTQEMDSANAASLFEFRRKYIKCLISDNNITPLEEALVNETQITDQRKAKTQSQRIRATLYRCWENAGLSIDFDTYYQTETERYLEHLKKQLPK